MTKQRAPKKTVEGTVVSDKMDKTISVREDRLVPHPRYGKYIRRASVYKAHDPANEACEGDRVEILHGRPLSKTKSWRLLRVIRRSHGAVPAGETPSATVDAAGDEAAASGEASS